MPVMVVILAHAAVDTVLIVFPWDFDRNLLLFLSALAIPVAQNGMIALWAATHSSPSYVRCVGLSLGVVATWNVLMWLMPSPVRSARAAGWGVSFLVQALVIVLLISLLRPMRLRHESGTATANRFSLAALLLWMAALTVPLVLLRLAIDQFGWTLGIFEWEFFPQLVLLGAFNGLFGVVVCVFLDLRTALWLRVAGGCLVVLALCWVEAFLLQTAFTTPGGMNLESAVQFAAAQLVILYATLVPLHCVSNRSHQAGARHRFPLKAQPRVPIDEVRVTPADYSGGC